MSKIITKIESLDTSNNPSDPFFSVIIPTFNRSEELNICLTSLVNQTYKNFEVIICDDGSTDNSKSIVEQYKAKLKLQYFWSENWGGPARPRNNGIQKSKGKWISFLDADDWWYSDKLEKTYEAIKRRPESDIICHDLIKFEVLKNKRTRLRCGPISSNLYVDLLKNGNRFLNSGFTVRKNVLNNNNILINESKNAISVEDFDLSLNLALHKANFYCLNIPLGEYTIESTNISNSNNHLVNLEFILHNHVFNICNMEINKNRLWNQVYSRINILQGIDSFKRKYYSNSVQYFIKSIKLSRKAFLFFLINKLRLHIKIAFTN